MKHQERFAEAVRASGISRVLVIDDAFDPPTVTADVSGALLDFLERDEHRGPREAAGLDNSEVAIAIDALQSDRLSDDMLAAVVGKLYGQYVSTLDPRFDPDGIFRVAKGDNLKNLKPLLALLASCNPPLAVTRIGSDPAAIAAAGDEAHLIFVDFYLDQTVAADDLTENGKKLSAKEASLDRIRRIMRATGQDTPSVVLMSSHQVRERAAAFREEIGGGAVFASRFAFINKTELAVCHDGIVAVAHDAADALLDIVQTYQFGRSLYAALTCWIKASQDATKALAGEIEGLALKDFAYLVRFRLAAEGQGLLEYLEWFFGECLLHEIAKTVDACAKDDRRLGFLDGKAYEAVEGAFEGPTKAVADLFHRVRVEPARSLPGRSFRMGDLYTVGEGASTRVAAVITPDCDLIVRGGGRRSAARLLTVRGKLKPFDAPEGSVSDFLILDNRHYNVVWDTKDVSAQEFVAWPDPASSAEGIRFVGTLRPLYAQELQHSVLTDLGRVGVAVAPATGMSAAVQVVVRKKDGRLENIPLPALNPAPALIGPHWVVRSEC